MNKAVDWNQFRRKCKQIPSGEEEEKKRKKERKKEKEKERKRKD